MRPWLTRVGLLAVVVGLSHVAWLDLSVRRDFEGKRWSVPARIYARPLELYPGMRLSSSELEHELTAAGYRPVAEAHRPGTFSKQAERFEIRTREFEHWDGSEPSRLLEARFSGDALWSLTTAGEAVPLARIDPALIGRIYPLHGEDRLLVRLSEAPRLLIDALIAVEDRSFHAHHGISLRGIARALWSNLRAGGAVQGGSTLTQQFAKNFFLTSERSVWRKLNEAIIALLLEAHYGKDEILEAYLNEVYLGQDGARAIHGFGLASRFYFGRPLAELESGEIALLVGLVRGASHYNPRRHPERALERRNLILSILRESGILTDDAYRRALASPLGVLASTPGGAQAMPAFIDLVARQLRRDYREADLRSEGLRVFTTLSPRDQMNAERALGSGLERLDAKIGAGGRLQGAVVVTDRHSGEVLALVGDRVSGRQGFNRALDALRSVGSVIKPAVYLSALEGSDGFSLASQLDDSPLVLEQQNGTTWSPTNYDRLSHGSVPLIAALANSYNVATVRLGLRIGVERVVRTLQGLGIERDIPPYPSTLLGALSLTPIEVAGAYQTLAGGGFRTPLRAIREVSDAEGEALSRYGLAVERAFSSEAVFLVNRALIEAMQSGTGRGVRAVIPKDLVIAGKTGTTNDLRDSWFAGFDESRLAVVWIGKDDNTPTGLTGASGALTVWAQWLRAVGPRSLEDAAPDGIAWLWTDIESGHLTDEACPGAVQLPFAEKSRPAYRACHRVASGGGLASLEAVKESQPAEESLR